MRRIGVVVNPVAGMGGRVGLKGTDGKVEAARERGAEPRAPDRARDALEALAAAAPGSSAETGGDGSGGGEAGDGGTDDGPDGDGTGGTGPAVTLLTYGDPMGASVAREAGFDPEVVGEPADSDATSAADTRAAVAALVDAGVDLLLFVGGDGTAVDVATTLDDLGADVPILGVPAGVKIYSEVFAVSPAAAGRVAATFDETERAEVNDVDEDRYRDGEVHTELRAVATVPVADRRQSAKQLAGGSVEGLAEAVAEEVRECVTYVFGPGSTVGAVEAALGVDGTPLGVDVWRDGEVLARDAGESEILASMGEDNEIVVSPIGGQGFVFGRGNQQLSPAVIRNADVTVVGSRRKLDGIGALRVDTGDPELDEELRGWQRVRVGAYETRLVEVV